MPQIFIGLPEVILNLVNVVFYLPLQSGGKELDESAVRSVCISAY